MDALYVSCFSSESERLWRDTEQTSGLTQIEPWLYPVRRWPEDRNLVIRSERGDPLAGPAITVSGHQTVPVVAASSCLHVSLRPQHERDANTCL